MRISDIHPDLLTAAKYAHSLSEPCPHPDCDSKCEFVKPPANTNAFWTCYGCGRPLETISNQRVEAEIAVMAAIHEQDQQAREDAASLYARGVTVAYLNAFTNTHDCWDWPTWRVVRDIIKPLTASTRQRFADLLLESEPTVIGPPSVFVSHSWAAKWGVLVAAVSRGNEDGTRRVWLDVFAVRQWPGNEADKDFRGVVDLCRAVIVVVSHEVFQESKFYDEQRYLEASNCNYQVMFEPEIRAKLPFARSWCLAEIVAGILADKVVIVTAGTAYRKGDSVDNESLKVSSLTKSEDTLPSSRWVPSRSMAVSYFGILEKLSKFAKLEYAEAGMEGDQNRIHGQVEETIGFRQFNAEAKCAILGGSLDDSEAFALYALVFDGKWEVFRSEAAKRRHPRARSALLLAVASIGIVEAVDLLINEFGYEIDNQSVPAMWAACGMGRLNVAKYLVSRWGAKVDVFAGNHSTPLANASLHGCLRVVNFLLDQGADPNLRGFRGTTALINAAKSGHVEVVLALKQKNADVEVANDAGERALFLAAQGGYNAVVEALVKECGAAVDAPNGDSKFTALHNAAAYGEDKVVRSLLDLGANVDTRAKDGSTPLIIAAMNGNVDTVKVLLDSGADLCATNESGWSTCIVAAYEGKVDVLRSIGEKVVEGVVGEETLAKAVDLQTTAGQSALDAAIAMNHIEAIKVLVVNLKVDINEPNGQGLLPLGTALQCQATVEMEDLSVVETLLTCGADVGKKYANGSSVLFRCMNRASLDLLTSDEMRRKTLMRLIDAQDSHGNTALSISAWRGNVGVIEGLVDTLGAAINHRNKDDRTPLHMAAYKNFGSAVQACLKRGADLNIRDNEGLSPLEIAWKMGSDKAVAVLTKRGGR